MNKRFLLGLVVFLAGVMLAQQPVPTGKSSDSGKNYRSPDGTLLTKKSSDADLARALNESYANDPEFYNVQVTVKHHLVTLAGSVETRDAKKRAQSVAQHFEGVREVQNRLKLGAARAAQRDSTLSSAH